MKKIIIIGSSASGIAAAKEIRAIDKDVSVQIITDDEYYPYYRPYLTEYIANKEIANKSNFYLNDKDWYGNNNIEILLREKVVAINSSEKKIITESGLLYNYDKLIIAIGSRPFVPFDGALKKKNVFAIRTYNDAREVFDYSSTIKKAIVIGGGLLGLEAASSLVSKGIRVTIIELADRILPQFLDDESSLYIEKEIKKQGVEILLGKKVKEIIGSDIATGVALESAEIISADMILISIGIRSNIELARKSGIAVDRAVIVNSKMETSVQDIYACGDVSQFKETCVALWMPALKMGKVAGANAAGKEVEYKYDIYPAVLNSFGLRLYSYGSIGTDGTDVYKEKTVIDHTNKKYKKLFFENGVLCGFILINDMLQVQKLSKAVQEKITYQELVENISN